MEGVTDEKAVLEGRGRGGERDVLIVREVAEGLWGW
jgi:hypothetical protein